MFSRSLNHLIVIFFKIYKKYLWLWQCCFFCSTQAIWCPVPYYFLLTYLILRRSLLSHRPDKKYRRHFPWPLTQPVNLILSNSLRVSSILLFQQSTNSAPQRTNATLCKSSYLAPVYGPKLISWRDSRPWTIYSITIGESGGWWTAASISM